MNLMPEDDRKLGTIHVHKDSHAPKILRAGCKRTQQRIDKWVPKLEKVQVHVQSGNIWSFSDATFMSLARKVGALRVQSTLVPEIRMELHEICRTITYDSLIVADAKPLKKAKDGRITMPTVGRKEVAAALANLGLEVWLPEREEGPPAKKRRPPATPWEGGPEGGGAGPPAKSAGSLSKRRRVDEGEGGKDQQ